MACFTAEQTEFIRDRFLQALQPVIDAVRGELLLLQKDVDTLKDAGVKQNRASSDEKEKVEGVLDQSVESLAVSAAEEATSSRCLRSS
jgi:hypothetical protein